MTHSIGALLLLSLLQCDISWLKLNTQNKNPKRSSIVHSAFPVDSIMGNWTVNLSGIHADFVLNKRFISYVDCAGNCEFIYTIKKDTISIYLSEDAYKGTILKACGDTLEISWGEQGFDRYFRHKH
jgi:hypothetical protein